VTRVFAAQRHVPASLPSHREKDDAYPAIVVIGDVRVIRCKDELQWIVQRKQGREWNAK
jgi:hypothetical protein